ncbi:hypothetical protein [Hyphomicrobium sp. MC8b]|uniref:hypothetical protein n=1 Tax=Hyphomicrobium sp. MC8b TaxID=300273 RepID=UPI00391BB02E
MKLHEQIEAMRRSMVEEADFTMNQLDHLHKRLVARHPEMMAKIQEITAIQALQGTELITGLMTIAARIGHVPSPAQIVAAQQAVQESAQTEPTPPAVPEQGKARLRPPPFPAGGVPREEMDRIIERSGVH